MNNSMFDPVSAAGYNLTATKTASYQMTVADRTVRGDATAGSITITPVTANLCKGQIFMVKKIDSSANTVSVLSTDGATTVLSSQYSGVMIQSNGTNYDILANI